MGILSGVSAFVRGKKQQKENEPAFVIQDSNVKSIQERLVHTPFALEADFRLEIEGAPENFELFVKDMSYGITEIETDEIIIGTRVLTLPKQIRPVQLSVTLRDTYDGQISQWFDNWANAPFNPDGTQVPPLHPTKGWVKSVKGFRVREIVDSQYNFEKTDLTTISYTEAYYENTDPSVLGHETDKLKEFDLKMFATQRGDVSRDYANNGFFSFPCTFMQFRS